MDRILVPTVYVHCCIPIHVDGTSLDRCDLDFPASFTISPLSANAANSESILRGSVGVRGSANTCQVVKAVTQRMVLDKELGGQRCIVVQRDR